MVPMSGTGTRTGTDPATVAREAWETRPARRGEDTKIAGVAGAVARRYDLDPTLVRVAFVVWAIVGGGLLAYLLAWLVLPADPADPPRRDRAAGRRPGGRRGTPPMLLIATVVVAIGTLVPAFDGRVVTFVALGLAAVTVYLLHTSRADLGVPGTPGTPAPGTYPLGPPEARDEVPVDWDALGADPAGWRLPPAPRAVTPAAPREPRTRSVITPATIALALVGAGLAAAALLLGLPGVTAVWVPGAALAVVGIGLVVSALVPRASRPRRGLVVVAIPLLVATVIAAVAVTRPDVDGVGGSSGVGDLRATPTTAAQLLPSYSTGLGDVDLDLTRLAPGAPVSTTVESGAGDITVTVPTTADVTATCVAGFGDVDCLGRPDDTVTALVDPGPDGPGGQVVGLTVRSGAGDVAVRRG